MLSSALKRRPISIYWALKTSDNKAMETPQPKMINLTQVMEWVSAATRNNKDFLMKPRDLRLLYTLVMWEYITNHHRDPAAEPIKVEKNDQVVITETKLEQLVKLLFSKQYYPCFSSINQM